MKRALLSILVCIYVWPLRELSENPSQLPNMLTHLFLVFTVLGLDSMLRSLTPDYWPSASDCCFSASDWPFLCSGLTALRVSLLTNWPAAPDWLTSFAISSGLAGVRRHSSLCVLRAKVDKGVPLDTLRPVKDAKDKIPSLATRPRTHTETHTHRFTHIRPYIYLYIHIWMLITVPHLGIIGPFGIILNNY